jgi:hypothetical protein
MVARFKFDSRKGRSGSQVSEGGAWDARKRLLLAFRREFQVDSADTR